MKRSGKSAFIEGSPAAFNSPINLPCESSNLQLMVNEALVNIRFLAPTTIPPAVGDSFRSSRWAPPSTRSIRVRGFPSIFSMPAEGKWRRIPLLVPHHIGPDQPPSDL